jgi:prolipoprotein diacylglyceryltransferase
MDDLDILISIIPIIVISFALIFWLFKLVAKKFVSTEPKELFDKWWFKSLLVILLFGLIPFVLIKSKSKK